MKAIHEIAIASLFCPMINKGLLARAARFTGSREELIDYLDLKPLASHIDRILVSEGFKNLVKWQSQNHCQLCIRGDDVYPVSLLFWPESPALIWFQGSPSWKWIPFLSVVGSRHPSVTSLEWMDWQLAEFLRNAPVGIVSGGARGIDQRAHLLAIKAQRPTLALMPTGLRDRYPFNFRDFEEAILATGGAVVSIFPPDFPLYKSNFVSRNYVIAALSPYTLIVEAAKRSGTMVTANAATELGREVLAVPTSPTLASGLGNLDLLASGATMIRDATDLIAAWSRVGPLHRPPREVSEQ